MVSMRAALLALRAAFFLLTILTGVQLARAFGDEHLQAIYAVLSAAVALGAIVAEIALRRPRLGVAAAAVLGITVGFLLAWLFAGLIGEVLEPSPRRLAAIRLALTVAFSYFGVALSLKGSGDLKLLGARPESAKERQVVAPMLVDTSALVDGRLADLCATGAIDAALFVPRFVVDELQALADSQDRQKRARGRRGLDVLKNLRSGEAVEVEIAHMEPKGEERAPVDRKLVALAREIGARLVTTDSALEKRGRLDGVRVLNLHALARALQARAVVGDRLTLRLVKVGEEPEQAVGYLEDGSMVVVEKAQGKLGEEVAVEVTSAIRTAAGQMFFGRLCG